MVEAVFFLALAGFSGFSLWTGFSDKAALGVWFWPKQALAAALLVSGVAGAVAMLVALGVLPG